MELQFQTWEGEGEEPGGVRFSTHGAELKFSHNLSSKNGLEHENLSKVNFISCWGECRAAR
jgi:hypothetical protein